jgi:hypothetical protein
MAGPDGLYSVVSSVFQLVWLLWIGLGVAVVGTIVVTMFRSRHSSWVRRPEEIRVPLRSSTPVADPDERVA